MLMTMRAFTEAMRAVAYVTASALDNGNIIQIAAARAQHQAFAEFMVPIVKGWCTETAQRVANFGLASAWRNGFYRGDRRGATRARCADHYDLRRHHRNPGKRPDRPQDGTRRRCGREGYIAEIEATANELSATTDADLIAIGSALRTGAASLTKSLQWLLESYSASPREAFAGSVPYLQMWGTVCGGWQMGRAALTASRKLAANEGDADFLRAKLVTARYYTDALLPEAQALAAKVTGAGRSVLALSAAQF